MRIQYAQLSTIGPVRQINEDALAILVPADDQERRQRGSAFVIADGVGGQADGELASNLAVSTALQTFLSSSPGKNLRRLLRDMFHEANNAILQTNKERKISHRMATTLTIALIRDGELQVGHIGDCRAYLIRGSDIWQLTADHTHPARPTRKPNSRAAGLSNVLSRAVGMVAQLEVDYSTITLAPGDRLVQCSDGLYRYVTEDEMMHCTEAENLQEACIALIQLAEKRGGFDNLSVQVARIQTIE